MILSIKPILKQYGIDGDILLYRDKEHRKKKLCEYIAFKLKNEIGSKTVCTTSDGAFGLYLARALPQNKVVTCCYILSHDYGEVMLNTSNLKVQEGFFVFSNPEYIKKFSNDNNYYFISQFNNDIILEYYYKYFDTIVNEVEQYNIDAFCDCSHTGATITGFKKRDLEINTGWDFVVGVNREVGEYTNYTKLYEKYFCQYTSVNYNTLKIGELIEKEYPEFGNVYETTRSISSSMEYLKHNPGKTVLVYVGDSFNKEGTKFNMYSKSQVSASEMRLLHKLFDSLSKRDVPSYQDLKDYYLEVETFFDDECKRYIFSFVLSNTIKYFQRYGSKNIYDSKRLQYLCDRLIECNKLIEIQDLELFKSLINSIVIIQNDDTKIDEQCFKLLSSYKNYKGNDLILRAETLFIMEMLFAKDPTLDFESLEFIHEEMNFYREQYRRLHSQLYRCGENFLKKVL